MIEHLRRAAVVLLVAWVCFVVYLTMTSAGSFTPPLTLETFFCIACSYFGVADLIRNWIMFLPGGVLVAVAFRSRAALAIPLLLTALVEFVQIGTPGRDPAFQDLLFNGLGAVSGFAMVRFGLARAARFSIASMVVALWLAPTLLLVPLTSPYDLYGQWTPRFARTTPYEGRVLQARVGDVETPTGLVTDKAALDEALRSRAPVRLRVEVAPPPRAFKPVFQIADGERNFVLELGALHEDLILRGRNPARILRLDQPDVRWPGALRGVSAGDTVDLVVERDTNSVCMSIDTRTRCGLAPSLGDGWGFVLNLESPDAWIRAFLSLLWSATLGFLLGSALGPSARTAGTAVTLVAIGYLLAALAPDVRPDIVHAGSLLFGALVGALLHRPIAHLWRELDEDG